LQVWKRWKDCHLNPFLSGTPCQQVFQQPVNHGLVAIHLPVTSKQNFSHDMFLASTTLSVVI
jgi:hypothetical protein